jgi:hypothetical protein
MKTWQVILITAVAVYMLRNKIGGLPGVSNLPTL